MLKTINSDGSLKISLIGSTVPAGAIYNGGLAYAPDGSLYVKLTQGALSGQTYNGGLACTPDGALYVANSTPAASATFRRGLLCRADGAVHVSDATVATVRHDGGVPKDNAGRLFVGIPLSGLAASFDANTGITSSGGFASAWADQSGNGRSLLQATGANQPIHLPFDGGKYGWIPGISGEGFTSPDSVAASIPGPKEIRVRVSLSALVHAGGYGILVDKITVGILGYGFFMDSGSGKLAYFHTTGGVICGPAVSTVTLAAAGLSANTYYWLRVTHDTATGNVAFYYAADSDSIPSAWTQIGATVASTAGVEDDTASGLGVGRREQGGAGGNLFPASFKRALLYNGIDGTIVADFDPSRWTSGTTFTASTGETWTINGSGSKPAQIVDRASLLFDGAAHYMKTAPFTLNQPETVYLVAKQVSWTISDQMTDGDTSGTMRIFQDTTAPNLGLYAGSLAATNGNLAVGAKGVVCAQFNGANSLLQINQTSAVTGNAGASNAGGFTFGATAAPGNYTNIQAYEALIYNVAHDAATRANIIRALMAEHGVA